jgi:hypothetical protein
MLRAFLPNLFNFGIWQRLKAQRLQLGNPNRKENGQGFTLKIINQLNVIEARAVNT